jgi:hypothetical protein
MGQGLLSVEASRKPSDTPHSAELLWTSYSPKQGPLPYITQHSQETSTQFPPAGFELAIPAS